MNKKEQAWREYWRVYPSNPGGTALIVEHSETWWDGTAMWYSVGNYEYQSIDMTWIGGFPRLFTAMSHTTLFWEIFYCALIWPRRTRPIVLVIAVAVHGGIALTMGMMTFGFMMITANGIFIEPATVRRWLRLDASDAQSISDDAPESDISLPSVQSPETPAQQSEREAELAKREKQVRLGMKKLRSRRTKQKERERKFRERVKVLKERETKIKELVARRRARKNRDESS